MRWRPDALAYGLAGAATLGMPMALGGQPPPGAGRPYGDRPATPAGCAGGGDAAAHLLRGTAIDDALAALKRTGRSGPVRVVRQGDMIPMDMIGDRLTIVIDAEGRVVRAYCG